MASLLYDLYNGDYDINENRDEAQEEIYEKLSMILDQIKEAHGLDFVDQLTNLYGIQTDMFCFQSYREGFRLGAALMLEALRPG